MVTKPRIFKYSFIILLIFALILVLFVNIKSKYEQDRKSKFILQEYEKMVQYATEHSEEIKKVSEILQENREFIRENVDYTLYELKEKLNEEERELINEIQSIAPYDADRVSIDTLESKEEFHYQWGFYEDNIRMIIIYETYDFIHPLTFGWCNKLTKISDHLYVAMVIVEYV